VNYTFRTAAQTTTPPPATGGSWQQTTATDFGGGTAAGVTVADTAGGELQLAPALRDDFDAAPGSQWSVDTWNSGGSSTASGGILSIAGQQLSSSATFGATSVEGRVAFGAARNQEFGLATELQTADASWAIFSTKGTTNTLYARVNVGGGVSEGVSLGAIPSGFHTYRIQPVAGGFSFYVDDVRKTTINLSFAAGTATRVMMSAVYPAPQPALRVDWVRVPSYAAQGTFTSAAYDAGASADWTTAKWTANLPAGTSIRVETSTGDSATPDSTWSAWAAVDADGTITSPNGRYARYRVTLISADGASTPTLYDITLNRA
jgi:hypothetical protein